MKIVFGADTKALLAKYCLDIWLYLPDQVFPEGQKLLFSVHCPADLYYVWPIFFFFLVFVTNYPISWQSDIIFGYPLTGQFDTIWQA